MLYDKAARRNLGFADPNRCLVQKAQLEHHIPKWVVARPAHGEPAHLLELRAQSEEIDVTNGIPVIVRIHNADSRHFKRVAVFLAEDLSAGNSHLFPLSQEAGGTDISLKDTLEGPRDLV